MEGERVRAKSLELARGDEVHGGKDVIFSLFHCNLRDKLPTSL